MYDLVTSSSDRSLNASLEVEEPAKWVYRPGLAPIVTSILCLRSEICPEAISGNPLRQNTQPVLVLPLLIVTGIFLTLKTTA